MPGLPAGERTLQAETVRVSSTPALTATAAGSSPPP